MKRESVRLMVFCVMLVFLSGCRRNETDSTSVDMPETIMESEEYTGSDAAKAEGYMDETELEESEEPEEPDETGIIEEPEEPVNYQVMDVTELIKAEDEIDLSMEDGELTVPESDTILTDTVEYVESSRTEIMRIRETESVVDENDPSTYKVVKKEQEVETVEEVPVEYTDRAGNVQYIYEDDVWYSCKYSSGEITMSDEEDIETVLLLMNMFGEYDDYEVVSVDCDVLEEDGKETQYAYRVLYRKKVALSELPDNLENLKVNRTIEKVTVQTEIIEEKVPVILEEKVGTGEYIYYGWQELDGDTFYFDKNGEKVTGMQVIKGIRYLFDDRGVLIEQSGVNVSSRNGVIDWKAVRRAGLDCAMIRCGYRGSSEGMLIQDAQCEENIKGARKEGLETMLWFYSQAVNEREAVEEASYIVALAEKYQISTPLVIAEGYSRDFSGRADGLSIADRTKCAEAFCRTIQNAGYTPMIYGSAGMLENGLDMSVLGSYSLWLAQYDSGMTYADRCEVWQYTAKADIDGIGGYTSLNIRYEN